MDVMRGAVGIMDWSLTQHLLLFVFLLKAGRM